MWTHKTMSDRRIAADALKYASKVYESFDTPVSLACALLVKYGEFEQLARKSVLASDYLDSNPARFFADYQSVKLMSKYPALKTGIDTKAVASAKFHAAEARCSETNARFRLNCFGSPEMRSRFERILHIARSKIASILGDVPSLSSLDFSFGPGAAYGVRGETSVFNKVTSALECTYAFAGILRPFMKEFPGWFPEGSYLVNLTPGSQLSFVPKDATTDRPICIEPLLNGLYQKGVGTHMRKRLKRHGIDLDDQSINQGLAAIALDAGLATVDFASASDTIAYLLVLELLPIDWFEFLDIARSPVYEEDGEWREFSKFTSMGNAYTFELETLIFYALAYACIEESDIAPMTGINLSVYGDDVIIPQEVFDLFAEVSSICGFEVNSRKSFHKGVFFESCGHDYFNGTFVRPLQLKTKLDKLLPLFYAANLSTRLALRCPTGTPQRTIALLAESHWYVVKQIPKHLRVLGPEGNGDGHIVVPWDVACPARHPMYCGWVYVSYVEQAVRLKPSSRDVDDKQHEWPISYALYFTRQQGHVNPNVLLGKSDPQPSDNGKGYTVRGKTRVARQKRFVVDWLNPSGSYHSDESDRLYMQKCDHGAVNPIGSDTLGFPA